MKEKIKQKFGKLRARIGVLKNKISDWKSGRALKIFLAASVVLLIVLIPTHHARAGWVDEAIGKVVSMITFYVSTLFGLIFGMFILVEAWLIGVVLQINLNVVNTSIVQRGFGVTLALANLGFVLGIIVIAIATILRRETYGIKQILWKLVAAAILVNFSLVIAGPIVGFSNSITNQFMSNLPGQGGGYWDFATNMASVFQPQQFMSPDAKCAADANNNSVLLAKCLENSKGALNKTASEIGNSFGQILAIIFPILGSLIGLLLIEIVLFVFFLTLLIRYVYLTVLLILMPLAWVAWVFPKFSGQWSKWWSKFFQWTFYPPIVVFFIWLVIGTGAAIRGGGADSPWYDKTSGSIATLSSTASNPAASAISNLFGDVLAPVISTALNALLLCGLIVGGMIAAQSMSITGAGMAVSAAKGIQKGITSWSGKQGKKLGRMALQRTGLTERLEQGRLGRVLGRIPGAQRLAGIGGRQLRKAELAGGANLVEAEMRNVPKDKGIFMSQLMNPRMKKELQLAFLQTGVNTGWLKDVKNIGGKTAEKGRELDLIKNFLTENQRSLGDFHQGKLREDANVATGSNQEMRDAEKERNAAKTPELMETAAKRLDEATNKFVAGLDKSDVAKMSVEGIFSRTDPGGLRIMEALQKSVAKMNPALIPGMLNKMKGSTLKNFESTYRASIAKVMDETVAAPDTEIPLAEKEAIFKRLEFAEDALNRAIANNAFGFSPGATAAPGAAAAGAAAPTPPPSGGAKT